LRDPADDADNLAGDLSSEFTVVSSRATAYLSGSDTLLSRAASPTAKGEGVSESVGWCKQECNPKGAPTESACFSEPSTVSLLVRDQ
jgi:hypothetical protein